MDIVSHGLWGALAFGRKSRASFWLAFGIGLAPDLFSFGILWAAATMGLSPKPDFSHGTPPESSIPLYVHYLYDVTHSFVVFLAVFALLWMVTKRPVLELGAWGLHVLVDIPTHSFAFFRPRFSGRSPTGSSTGGNGISRPFLSPTSPCCCCSPAGSCCSKAGLFRLRNGYGNDAGLVPL